MKPYNERLPLIDAAIDELSGYFPQEYNNPCLLQWRTSGKYCTGTNNYDSGETQFICTRQEFEQRKAELQNKPSWKDAPEWANWLAQQEQGLWVWFRSKPKRQPDGLYSRDKQKASGKKGKVIGNWQDTLEQRPETQDKEQEMNNDWYEKNERPPVGEKLMGARIISQDGVEDWFDFPRYEVVAHHINGKTFFVEALNGDGDCIGTQKFDVGCDQYKPLHNETDKLVEQIFEVIYDKDDYRAAAEELVKQGYRKIKPMSEEEFVTQSRKEITDHLSSTRQLKKLYRAGCRFLDQGE